MLMKRFPFIIRLVGDWFITLANYFLGSTHFTNTLTGSV